MRRRGLAEPRRDPDEVARDVRQQDLLVLERALADQALAQPEDLLPARSRRSSREPQLRREVRRV